MCNDAEIRRRKGEVVGRDGVGLIDAQRYKLREGTYVRGIRERGWWWFEGGCSNHVHTQTRVAWP